MYNKLAETRDYGEDIATRRMNTREHLEARKEQLEEQLKNINNAIEALDQNPNVEKVLDLLSKV